MLATLINALRGIWVKIDADSVESPEISNIVFSGELENITNGIDLRQLVRDLGLDQACYESERFSQIVYRPDELDCVILIFSSGKSV